MPNRPLRAFRGDRCRLLLRPALLVSVEVTSSRVPGSVSRGQRDASLDISVAQDTAASRAGVRPKSLLNSRLNCDADS